MSTGTQTADTLEAPAAVLDGLAIYDSHAVLFDHDRTTCERRTGDGKRVYLVAKFEVAAQTPSATGDRDLLGLYATVDGQASIRFASDEAAQIEGLLAHSLVEPVERLRELGEEGQELLSDRVADIGGFHQ